MRHDPFLHPRCRSASLDTFVVRRSILRAVTSVLPRLSGTLLDVGCGYRPYRSLVVSPPSRVDHYVGVDLPGNVYGRPDLAWDGRTLPVRSDAVGAVLLTEVLEHTVDPGQILAEVRRIVRPDGLLVVTVPFLWPLHEVPRDEQRLTPFALERMLRTAGFAAIEISALGGWDAALAQMAGLWVRRRLCHGLVQRTLRAVLSPAIALATRALLARDRPPQDFVEGSMITGLVAVASRTSS